MLVILLSLVAGICYTLSGILALFGMKESNPATVTLASMLVNTVFLWPITLVFSPIILDNRAVLLFALSAAFAPVTGRLLNYKSLEKVGVATTTSIQGIQPIFVTILATIFLAEHFPAIVYLAIAITVMGVTIVGRSLSKTNRQKDLTKWALLFPFSSTFCYSTSNILRKVGLQVQGLPLLAASFTVSFSTIYLFLSLLVTRQTRQIVITRSSSLYSVLSGIVNSLAWISSFQALQMGAVSIVGTILGLQPIIGIVLSYLFLRKTEIITLSKIAGAILVVFGVTLISILS